MRYTMYFKKKPLKILKMPSLNYSLKKIQFIQVAWPINKVNLNMNNLFLKSELKYTCNHVTAFDWFLSLKDFLIEKKSHNEPILNKSTRNKQWLWKKVDFYGLQNQAH